jgi:hypothetical protein
MISSSDDNYSPEEAIPHPIETPEDVDELLEDDAEGYRGVPVRYRGATNDPVFGVLAWLFGNTARVGQETPDNVIWGVSFGLILAAPLFAFGGGTLNTAVRLIMTAGYNFGQLIPMSNGSALAYLIFVMPLAETLFFRGVIQENRPFWVAGLMGTLWSVVLFFPLMDLQHYPIVGFVICLVLAMMNLMYSYVRQRNGLAAAWICQIVVNLVLVFLPYLGQ